MTLIATLLHDATNERRRLRSYAKRKPVPIPGCVSAKAAPTCTLSLESACASPSASVSVSVPFPSTEVQAPTVVSAVSFPCTSPPYFPSSSQTAQVSSAQAASQPHALLRPRQRIAGSFSSGSAGEGNKKKRPSATSSSSAGSGRKRARKTSSSSSSSSSSTSSSKAKSEGMLDMVADEEMKNRFKLRFKSKKAKAKEGKTKRPGDLKIQLGTYKCLVSYLTRRCALSPSLAHDREGDVVMDSDLESPFLPSPSSSPSTTSTRIEQQLKRLPERGEKEQLETQDRLLAARLRSFLVWQGVDVESLERDVAGYIADEGVLGEEKEEKKEEGAELEMAYKEQNDTVDSIGSVEASSSLPTPTSTTTYSDNEPMDIDVHIEQGMGIEMQMDFPESDLRSIPGPGLLPLPSPLPSSTARIPRSSVSPPPSTVPTRAPPTAAHIIAQLLIRPSSSGRRRSVPVERKPSPLRGCCFSESESESERL